MKKDRRKGLPPIPDDVMKIISSEQKKALAQLSEFRWEIEFVRRPLFQAPRVVVRNPRNGRLSVVEEDGTVDHNPIDLVQREPDDD